MKNPTLNSIFRQALFQAKVPKSKSQQIFSERRATGQRLRFHNDDITDNQIELMQLYIETFYPSLKARIERLNARCSHKTNTMTPKGVQMRCEISSKEWREIPCTLNRPVVISPCTQQTHRSDTMKNVYSISKTSKMFLGMDTLSQPFIYSTRELVVAKVESEIKNWLASNANNSHEYRGSDTVDLINHEGRTAFTLRIETQILIGE